MGPVLVQNYRQAAFLWGRKKSVIEVLFSGKCSSEIRECSGKTQACPFKNIWGHILEVAQGIFFVGVSKRYQKPHIMMKPWNLLIPATCVLKCIRAGQGSEDAGKPAARPGVFRQGQVVQHPGGRLEPADPAAVRGCAGAAPHPPGNLPELVSRLLWLLRGGWLPKLYETVQLVDRKQQIKTW